MKPNKYDADFKNEVLKMVESGHPVPGTAQLLGIGSKLICYWVKRAKKGISPTERQACTDLRRRKTGTLKTGEATGEGAGNF